MRTNNNETINPSQAQQMVEQVFFARSKKVKKVVLVKSDQGGASSDTTVYVPAGETAYDRTVRLHEALHLDFTTEKFNPKDVLDQGLEDARLHAYCGKTKSIANVRRDEITVAIRDLRKAIKKSKHERPTAITSLVILRAAAILNGETKYSKLLNIASGLIAPEYLLKCATAIKLIETGTESPNFKKARKILKKYFVKDFQPEMPQQQSESKQTEQQESESQIDPNELPDLPSPESEESEPDQSESEESDEDSKSDESEEDKITKDLPEDNQDDEGADTDASGDSDIDQTGDDYDESGGEGEDETNIIGVVVVAKPKKKKLHPDVYRGAAVSKYDPDQDSAQRLNQMYHKDLIIHRLDNGNDSVPTIQGNRGRISSMSGCRINSGRLALAAKNNVRVFNRRRGEGGGAILIDNSGSMSIPNSTLIQFAASLPLATIAFYSAKNDLDKTKEGHLSVYAANGRRAKNIGTEVYGGYGNLVDYQAITWLMEQPGPRWYIGDLGFTGMWSMHCDNFFRSLVDRKLVTYVRELDEMKELLD